MSFQQAHSAPDAGSWGTILELIATEGSASSTIVAALRDPGATLRDVADAVHCLCMLHGRHPGVIDHAATHAVLPAAQPWLAQTAEGFARERSWLIQLVAAVGPLPSTPGQSETEAAIAAQSHALDMLALSDRSGCAAGAAVAIALDWVAVRGLLDAAGHRLGLDVPPLALPDVQASAAAIAACSGNAAVERALLFGARQALSMHRGLWDLIEARASAREAH